jgi:hypothetical protein
MKKIILAAAMIVASIASVAPASAALQIVTGTVNFPPHSGLTAIPSGIPQDCFPFFQSLIPPLSKPLSGPPPYGLVVLETLPVTFAQPVSNAVAVITGWDVEFSNGDDHYFGRQIVAAGTVVKREGTQLYVCIAYGLRDFSGVWDDKFEGNIRYAVLVE